MSIAALNKQIIETVSTAAVPILNFFHPQVWQITVNAETNSWCYSHITWPGAQDSQKCVPYLKVYYFTLVDLYLM